MKENPSFICRVKPESDEKSQCQQADCSKC